MARFGDYLLVRRLGEGSHGRSFLAEPPLRLGVSDEYVVVKVLHREVNEDDFSRAAHHLAGVASVMSPHLARPLDVVRVDRSMGVVTEHGGLELARVALERGELGVDRGRDVLQVVGLVCFPQQQRRWPVVGHAVLAEEVRIPGRDDPLAREEARMTVIGMQSVPPPGIVPEHDVWAEHADPSRDL